MSNPSNITNPDVELEEANVQDENVVLEEEAPEAAPAPKKRKAGYRILSVLLLAIAVVACVLPLAIIRGTNVESQPLYKVILDAIGGNVDKWNAIPMIAGVEAKGLVYGFSVYFMILCVVVSAVLSIIGLIGGSRCVTKTSAGFLTAGFLYNFIAFYALSSNLTGKFTLDIVFVACLAASFLLYFILCAIQTKRSWYNLLQFVLSTGALFALAYGFVKAASQINAVYTAGGLNKYLIIAASAIVALVSLIMLIRLSCKKGFPFELVCFIFELLAVAVFLYLTMTKAKDMTMLAFIALAIAVVQFAIVLIVLIASRKRPEVEEAEEEAEPVVYEGGPIPVEEAEPVVEEVAEPVVEEVAPVETAEYDYYNSRAFDPFIASLSNEERNQFTEIFILKYKGTMPELPDYAVGGDNRDFFAKIFLYLGQYRDRIPDGLLAKIYVYSTKI